MTDIKQKKIRKSLGLGMVSVALLFYFFPDFSIIDILPDFVGYILTVLGISMLADMSEEMAEAKKRFSQMIGVSIAKFAAVILIFGTSSPDEMPNLLLTAVFVAGIAECLILIRAYSNMFDALLYFGTRQEGSAVFNGGKKVYRKSYTDTVKRSTVTFIIVKNILCIMPEMLSLSVDVNLQSYAYSNLNNLSFFRVIGMIISLIWGIVWLCKTRRYFSTVINDKPFMDRLTEKYKADILPNTSLHIRKKIHFSLFLLALAAILSIDFYIDGNNGYNIIPDIFSGILFTVGALIVPGDNKKNLRLWTVASGVLYSLATLASWMLNSYFAYEYTATEVSRDIIANRIWQVLTALSCFEAVLFMAMMGAVVISLSEMVKSNTGYLPSHPTIDPEAKARELHKMLNGYLYISSVLAVLTAMSDPFRVWMFSISSELSDGAWVIQMMITVIFASVFCRSLYRINEEAEEKYQLS